MKKLIITLLGLGLAIAIGASAYAAPFTPPGPPPWAGAPFLAVNIAGQSYEVGPYMELPNGKILFPKKKIEVGPPDKPDFVAELQMLGKVDPFISYTFSAINYSDNPTSFSTTGGIYLDPIITGSNTAYASLGASVTDLGGDGLSINPIATATDTDYDGVLELQTAFLGDGSNWTNLGVDVGRDFSTSAAIDSYGPFEAGEQPGPIGSWTELSYSLDFVLSPLDSVAFTGYVSIEPDNVAATPIPSTVWLFGCGLVGLVALRRKSIK